MIDLTVAICMYNAEAYIEETLDCIAKQTLGDFYLMIVNDCSTDGSRQKADAFLTEHAIPYEIVDLPENHGLCYGRRYVEEHAKTKYVLFVDADDCPYPTLVEKLYAKITSDEDLMAVGCYLEYIDEKGRKIGGGIFLGEKTKDAFYEKAKNEKLIFMQSTAIYDREVALSVGGHHIEGFPDGKPRYRDYCEDLDLWTRMSDLYKDGKAIVVVPEVLYGYRKHTNAMSGNSLGMVLRMRQIKKNLKLRRRGEKEVTFVEFRNGLTDEELRKIEDYAISADSLRKAYYSLKKGRVFSSIGFVFQSLKHDPSYLFDKIKHNIFRR